MTLVLPSSNTLKSLLLSLRRKRARQQPVRSADDGFTLLELLVVLGIVVMLAGLVGPRVLAYFSEAKTQTAQVQISNISSAIELYYLDAGTYPPEDGGLKALVEAPANAERWNGPYLKKASGLLDPWGKPFRYKFPGEHGDFDLYSLGLDDTEGGEDENEDIKNW